LADDDGRIHEFIAVFTDITQRKQDEEQIVRQANFDSLTGLPNRTLLFDRLSQAMSVAERDGTQLALLFIDLDRFKGVNDAMGHIAGDETLRIVAERLRNCVRQSDTVARFGGDEFVIVLERVASVRAVAALAEKVIRGMSEPFQLLGREIFIGASVGVSLFPEDARKAESLIRNADVAMYQAKEGGRNRYQFFVPEMNHRNEVRLELERGLRRALERAQFDVEYQPIYDLRTGTMVKVEALLRWKHPELGLIRPERFIPLAEESGLIAAIGLWVLRTACAQTSRLRRDPVLAHLGLAVNLSSRQWKLGLDADGIRAILADTGLPPEAVTLEITEGMVLEDTEEAIAWLRRIRAIGVRLAVDDFGTGYSSLSYLKRFPVDELKIDYSFVRDLPGDEGSVSLVYAILSLARSLGLTVVAEGVETPEQLAFLTQAGCDLVQGFLLSGPQAAEEIPALGRRPSDARFPQRGADLFS
jgi:diguanylate cyclase (GGDEF)-like protein